MRKSKITLAFNEHRNCGVVSRRLEKDFAKFKKTFDDDCFNSS